MLVLRHKIAGEKSQRGRLCANICMKWIVKCDCTFERISFKSPCADARGTEWLQMKCDLGRRSRRRSKIGASMSDSQRVLLYFYRQCVLKGWLVAFVSRTI